MKTIGTISCKSPVQVNNGYNTVSWPLLPRKWCRKCYYDYSGIWSFKTPVKAFIMVFALNDCLPFGYSWSDVLFSCSEMFILLE